MCRSSTRRKANGDGDAGQDSTIVGGTAVVHITASQ
jgi:hypothetical protein